MGLLCKSFTNQVAGLQSIDKFTEDLSLIRLEDFVNVAISGFTRYLEDILENEILL